MTKIYLLLLSFISIVNAQSIDHDTIDLKESIVYNKQKYKLKRFGPDTKTKTSFLVGPNDYLSTVNDSISDIVKAFAVYIKAPKKEYTIQQLNFNLVKPIEDTLKIKIDLLYNLNDKPGNSILKEPIYLNLTQKSQQEDHIFSLSLDYLNFKYKDEFYIYIELLNQKDKPIYFSAAMFSKCFYVSENNMQWQKTPLGISPSINADLLIKK